MKHNPCAGACSECQHAPGNEISLNGWRLVGPAMAVFLLPLVAALMGGLWFRSNPTVQLAGICAGLLSAMLAIKIVYELRKRKRTHDNT